MYQWLAAIVPIAPLIAAMVLGTLAVRGDDGPRGATIAWGSMLIAFLLSVLGIALVITVGPWTLGSWLWLKVGTVEIRFALVMDQLTAVMLVLVSGVSLIVHLYARRYMQDEPGYSRFYALLGATTAVTLAMVMAADLIQLFLLWQIMGVLLYLLLGFDLATPKAAESAAWSLIINRAGDVAFALGVLLLVSTYGTSNLAELFDRAAAGPQSVTLGWLGLSDVAIRVNETATLLIFIGAMAKSAQFPLHVWLPSTMDSPTPVSALMHAGLVNAGGFLLNRLAPLYMQTPDTLQLVFVVGTVTALIGSTIMLTQSDIKRALGYSTVGQMGYMMMEIGLGAFALAIFHLAAHGIFKATLFLNAGGVINATRRNPNMDPEPDFEPRQQLPIWIGLGATLAVPLLILIGVHELLGIRLEQHQGAVVLLFFGWVTASQAALSVYRAGARDSINATLLMLSTLFVVVLGYLWGGHSFEQFLYPARAGTAPTVEIDWMLFDIAIAIAAALILVGWLAAFRRASDETAGRARPWTDLAYVGVRGGLYLEALYRRILVRPTLVIAGWVDRYL